MQNNHSIARNGTSWYKVYLRVKGNEKCCLNVAINSKISKVCSQKKRQIQNDLILKPEMSTNFNLQVKDGFGKIISIIYHNNIRINYFIVNEHEKISATKGSKIPLNENMKFCVEFNRQLNRTTNFIFSQCKKKGEYE